MLPILPILCLHRRRGSHFLHSFLDFIVGRSVMFSIHPADIIVGGSVMFSIHPADIIINRIRLLTQFIHRRTYSLAKRSRYLFIHRLYRQSDWLSIHSPASSVKLLRPWCIYRLSLETAFTSRSELGALHTSPKRLLIYLGCFVWWRRKQD